MPITVSDRPQRASDTGHWYTRAGATAYTVIGSNGKERATTIRDARKFGWVPSVTTVTKAAARPGLERWKAEQLLMAALTLPRLQAETEAQWIQRVWEDSIQQAVKAAQVGTEIHAAIAKELSGQGTPDDKFQPFVTVALQALEPLGLQLWSTEKSFASPLGYGGKVDLHSDAIVLDFKTKDGDIELVKCFDEHFMQVAAYSYGLGLYPIARCGIVFVSRTVPVAKLVMHTQEETAHGWAMFKTLLAYWQEANEYTPTW